jgi:phage shock protein PspC (stress-responsive transcriptional regulator)
MGLYRSSDDKVLGGICGALAHKLELNSTGVHIVVFIVSFFLGAWLLAIVIYIALWVLLPERPTRGVAQSGSPPGA